MTEDDTDLCIEIVRAAVEKRDEEWWIALGQPPIHRCSPCPEFALGLIAAAIRAAVEERDFEYWEKCCLVDNVAPNPNDIRAWIIAERDLAIVEEREACARLAEESRADEEYGHAAFRCVQIAQKIRARAAAPTPPSSRSPDSET